MGDILYIEGLRNYVTLYTPTQKIVTLQRLRMLEDLLPPDKFIRVHNSFIVAKAAIASVEDNEVHIGSSRIPIGDTYLKSFMDFINGRHLR
jgi:DNA-binding LytR/AlgR family response regulator